MRLREPPGHEPHDGAAEIAQSDECLVLASRIDLGVTDLGDLASVEVFAASLTDAGLATAEALSLTTAPPSHPSPNPR